MVLVAIVSRNMLVLVFVGYHTNIARYVAISGIAQMFLCKTKYQGGGITLFQGTAHLPEKVSRDKGYRSDSIATSRDMGPLSFLGDFGVSVFSNSLSVASAGIENHWLS